VEDGVSFCKLRLFFTLSRGEFYLFCYSWTETGVTQGKQNFLFLDNFQKRAYLECFSKRIKISVSIRSFWRCRIILLSDKKSGRRRRFLSVGFSCCENLCSDLCL
jgi:hypothetical protein